VSNVDRLGRSLTAKQLLGWEAFDSLEPVGDERIDLLFASVVAMIANVNRGKDQKPFTLQDAMLKWDAEPKKRQTPEEQARIARVFVESYNRMVVSGQKVAS